MSTAPCCFHGQLFAAFYRESSFDYVAVETIERHRQFTEKIAPDIVYGEVLQSFKYIINLCLLNILSLRANSSYVETK